MHDAPLDTVITIDCHYLEPQRAAVYLLVEGDRAAFVDTNTAHAVPYFLAALAEEGLTGADVEYIAVTHVHLDHAGGTAALLKHCPNATVLAHPKAARHLIDPTRLIAGSKAVYGEAAFARLYGHIEALPEARVRALDDGAAIAWGGRTLRFVHTMGHASHHFVVHDSRSNCVFAGDAFGIGRNGTMRPGPPFMIASCTPPDFDAAAQRAAIAAILATGADRVGLGHFGIFGDLGLHAESLLRSLDAFEAIVREAAGSALPDAALAAFCAPRAEAAMRSHVAACGVDDLESDMHWLAGDAALNGMGLATAAQRLRKQRAPA